jgi:hypothetical protein
MEKDENTKIMGGREKERKGERERVCERERTCKIKSVR